MTAGEQPPPRGQLRRDIDHVHTVIVQVSHQRRFQAGCTESESPIGSRRRLLAPG
ncbi:hypothetical protein OPAG_05032 [Rhodococcus opacus PD630]|nr:hypothetical protein OPAG_05032 [Rhodococcus opacus PD630]